MNQECITIIGMLESTEMPWPDIGDKDLLIKVMACGICGSDIMEWFRIKRETSFSFRP